MYVHIHLFFFQFLIIIIDNLVILFFFFTKLKEVRVTKMSVRPNYISSGFADFRQEEILEELIGQTDEIRADQQFH